MSPSPTHPDDLTASHLTEIEFETHDPAYFFVGLSKRESCQVRLEELIHLADGTLIEFFTGEECSLTAIRERADAVPAIDSARIVHEGRDGVLFRLVISGCCIVETIEGAGAIPGSVTAVDGTGRVTAQVPRGVDSADVVAAVLDTHQNTELAAHRQLDASIPSFSPWGVRQVLQERATDRQWEVLRTAYRHGYFDQPREHSGQEVAEMLDISSATFSQHLRTALDNVLSVAIEDGSSDGARGVERR